MALDVGVGTAATDREPSRGWADMLAVGRRNRNADRDRTPGSGDSALRSRPAASATKRKGVAVHADLERPSAG